MFRSARFALVLFSTVLVLGPIVGCDSRPQTGGGPDCVTDADCDDGQFCNGQETCSEQGRCVQGEAPCEASEDCNEDADRCEVPCAEDTNCSDGNPCTVDTCVEGICTHETTEPCQPLPCIDDTTCDNGLYCDGQETCSAIGFCESGEAPCLEGDYCNEELDRCEALCVVADCPDDGQFCTGDPVCVDNECGFSGNPCAPGKRCDEQGDACVDCLSDTDCPAGEECENGQCVPVPCTTDLACGDGEVCDRDTGNCVLAEPGGTRGLPTCYEPDASFTVRIVVKPTVDTLVVGLQDFPPAGWTVSNISHDGEWDATNGAVKWFFLDDRTRTLTYTVTPALDAAGVACLDGQTNVDGSADRDIQGDKCIEPCMGT